MSLARERIDQIIAKNLVVLNRLDPHLGCALCRRPLVNGKCLSCQAVPGETPCSNRECSLLYAHSGPCDCRTSTTQEDT